MGDNSSWNRQQPQHSLSGSLKRPRFDYETVVYGSGSGSSAGSRVSGRPLAEPPYVGHAGAVLVDRHPLADTSELARRAGGVPNLYPVSEPLVLVRSGAVAPDLASGGRSTDYGSQLGVETLPRTGSETAPLPPDASSTLYVEGLPPDTTRREVTHIFRPFVGYREVRLAVKPSKYRDGDPLVMCFVDFASPAHAAAAMQSLQGYKMDDIDPYSPCLRLQFSRFPGPRSGPRPRGRR